jgi:eukaryotic-like serine/threonine-protein kinase
VTAEGMAEREVGVVLAGTGTDAPAPAATASSTPSGSRTPEAAEQGSAALATGTESSGGAPADAEQPAPSDPLIGTLVGERYLIERLLGMGGMGAVYCAEHVHMQKRVALKVLHREMTVLPEVVARFEQEAIAAARVEHPNVVQAKDFGRLENGAFYLVLEYVEGRILHDAMKEPMPLERVLGISGQIAEALEAAHQQRIVHRDLKPDNVMLIERPGEPELVKVLDFGIAKVSVRDRGKTDRPITQMGTVFGTPEYMSPEQAAGQSVDQRGDIYGLGILMYEMLGNAPPFTGDEVNAVLMMHITQPPPPLPSSVPLAVRQLVSELLAKDPGQRPQTAAEVVSRIEALLGTAVASSQGRTRARMISVKGYPRITWLQRLDSGPWGQRIRLAGVAVPAWRLVLLVCLLGAFGFASVLLAARGEAPPTVAKVSDVGVPPTVPAKQAAGDAGSKPVEANPQEDKLLGRVFLGDPKALEEIEQRVPDSLTAREWLAIARGRSKLGRPSESMKAYRAALEKEPTLGEEPALRRDVWEATRSPEAIETAMSIAADFLGSKGADMLYRLWVESKNVTPMTRLAKKLVSTKHVREVASPALAFVLDWRAAISCDDYERILPRAQLNGDQRALMVLQRSLRHNDCKLPEDTLRAAIMVVKDRPEPAPF